MFEKLFLVFFLSSSSSSLCCRGGGGGAREVAPFNHGASVLSLHLPKLQVAAGQLERPSAHVAFPLPQENATRVIRVRHQHSDTDPRTFERFGRHPLRLVGEIKAFHSVQRRERNLALVPLPQEARGRGHFRN